jgi:colanic acid biosynthesis glycosyl transferase WcaI
MRDLFPEAAQGLEGANNPCTDFILDRTNKFFLRRARAVVALGEMMRTRLINGKGVAADRVVIIHDWADTAAITPGAKDNHFSRAHGLAERFVVMYAGNLGASSGLEFVLDAARQLVDQRDIEFVFVGEGIMKPRLQQLAEGVPRVRFLPFQPREDCAAVFATADVFLVPLKRGLEGYSVPSKLYAVLASGRPYIASVEATSEVAQLTRDFGCGVVTPAEDAPALAQAILDLYNAREKASRMGNAAREAAGAFDRVSGVRRYYELLRKLSNNEQTTA